MLRKPGVVVRGIGCWREWIPLVRKTCDFHTDGKTKNVDTCDVFKAVYRGAICDSARGLVVEGPENVVIHDDTTLVVI